jgi:hypothetical protein
MAENHLEGGCLCGAIRYRVQDIFDVVYCHCSRCRRRSGAPVSLSLVVSKAAFEVTKGHPATFSTSEIGVSHFCPACGSPLFFAEAAGPYVSVSHGSLDTPDQVKPKAHQWVGSTLPWLSIDDDLARFEDGQLSHPGRREP